MPVRLRRLPSCPGCSEDSHHPPPTPLPPTPRPTCLTESRVYGVSQSTPCERGLLTVVSSPGFPSVSAKHLDKSPQLTKSVGFGVLPSEPSDHNPPLSLRQAEILVGVLLDGNKELSSCLSASPRSPELAQAPIFGHERPACDQSHLSPRPSPISDLGAPVRRHLDHGSFFSHDVVTRIKSIVVDRDEAKLAAYLTGEVAQTFIDVADKVCPCVSSPLRVDRLPWPFLPPQFCQSPQTC